MTRYSESTARAMWKLRMERKTLREVAKAFGVSEATVGAWVARYVRSGGFELVGEKAGAVEVFGALRREKPGNGDLPASGRTAVPGQRRIEAVLPDRLRRHPEQPG